MHGRYADEFQRVLDRFGGRFALLGFVGARGEPDLPLDRSQAILEAANQVGSLLKRKEYTFAPAGSVAVYAHGGSELHTAGSKRGADHRRPRWNSGSGGSGAA